MEAVIKAFPLQLIFRGLFPGAFFVVSFIVGTRGWAWIQPALGNRWPMWLALAAFLGIIAYVLHRSVIYPVIEFALDVWQPENSTCPLIRNNTTERLLDMWSTGAGPNPAENIARHLTAWNDYVHLQYASCWCILLGAIVAQSWGE